jgi:hypothetical protein
MRTGLPEQSWDLRRPNIKTFITTALTVSDRSSSDRSDDAFANEAVDRQSLKLRTLSRFSCRRRGMAGCGPPASCRSAADPANPMNQTLHLTAEPTIPVADAPFLDYKSLITD